MNAHGIFKITSFLMNLELCVCVFLRPKSLLKPYYFHFCGFKIPSRLSGWLRVKEIFKSSDKIFVTQHFIVLKSHDKGEGGEHGVSPYWHGTFFGYFFDILSQVKLWNISLNGPSTKPVTFIQGSKKTFNYQFPMNI